MLANVFADADLDRAVERLAEHVRASASAVPVRRVRPLDERPRPAGCADQLEPDSHSAAAGRDDHAELIEHSADAAGDRVFHAAEVHAQTAGDDARAGDAA